MPKWNWQLSRKAYTVSVACLAAGHVNVPSPHPNSTTLPRRLADTTEWNQVIVIGALNSGDTILISAVVPPVPPMGDGVRDAGLNHPDNARHGFSNPPPICSSNQ
jgi:hypothetical protein